MDTNKLLLIDDEQEFTDALRKRFEARGMNVETASSGEEALAKIESMDFDAVLLDLAMPGWDGVETLKHLKKLRPDIQVVLLTGHATIEKSVEAMKLGALDFVEKPIKFQQLLEKIEEASAKKAVLAEERIIQDLDEIVRKRGW
jgi:DNA-binding NtrC family response regulator